MAEVSIDLPTGKVVVAYDPMTVEREKMKAAIKDAGYEVID